VAKFAVRKNGLCYTVNHISFGGALERQEFIIGT